MEDSMSTETFVQKIVNVHSDQSETVDVLIQQGGQHVFLSPESDKKAGELAALLIEMGCTPLDPQKRYL
jgi:precorrin-6B methylase 1